MSVLVWLNKYRRLVLVAGLVIGIGSPTVATFLKEYIAELVFALLFFSALRIGPSSIITEKINLVKSVGVIVVFQVVMPLIMLFTLRLTGLVGTLPLALVVMAAGAPIAGTASLTIMTGNEGKMGLRLIVVGTALLPFTIWPVFVLIPELNPNEVVSASVRLLLIILGATVAAQITKRIMFGKEEPSVETSKALEGITALVQAIAVIGLLAAVGPAIKDDFFGVFATTFVVACAANFGLQLVVGMLLPKTENRAAYAIAAGNRNIALFVTALPVAITEPLFLFIGCYQIPSYLTPLLLKWFYKKQLLDGGDGEGGE